MIFTTESTKANAIQTTQYESHCKVAQNAAFPPTLHPRSVVESLPSTLDRHTGELASEFSFISSLHGPPLTRQSIMYIS